MSKRKNPTADDLIAEEEERFMKKFEIELIKLAEVGVAFTLPEIVVDHVADTEEDLSKKQDKEMRKRWH